MSTQAKYYPLDEDAARIAWNMNHFGTFRSDKADYMIEVDEAYSLADESAEQNPERAEDTYRLADKFACKLASWYNEKYRIESRCPSVLVAGPANFPTEKKEKQNQALDKHMKNLKYINQLKDKIQNVANSANIIKSDDDNAIDKLTAKIAELTQKQDDMKRANAAARREGKPAPYASFTLANNNQNIRSTKKRLAYIEQQKTQETTTREIEILGESATVVENTDIMRLQIVFEDKPAEEVRDALKNSGFRWSPKQKAWQRQLTQNARFALKFMLTTSK